MHNEGKKSEVKLIVLGDSVTIRVRLLIRTMQKYENPTSNIQAKVAYPTAAFSRKASVPADWCRTFLLSSAECTAQPEHCSNAGGCSTMQVSPPSGFAGYTVH